MMTYEEARNFIEQVSGRGSVLGLSNMYALMEALGNPQEDIAIVHIAGTNGKGSTGAYLAAILKEAGLMVGRYCSPAVFDTLECWQYDGRNITKEEYARYLSQVKKACDIVALQSIEPTAFEIETALAFVYAKEMQVDVLLLETGLGGATDATNIIKHPLACVFTTISRDHMQFLGETLTEIASVKAGIIKPDAVVVSATQTEEVQMVLDKEWLIQNTNRNANASDRMYGVNYIDCNALALLAQAPGELSFEYKGNTYTTALAGSCQMQNAALAIETAEAILPVLFERKECKSKETITRSVTVLRAYDCAKMNYETQVKLCQKAIANTSWPGRFEVLGDAPLFIIDGAHNEDAVKQLAFTIEKSFTNQPITFIIGILADKEHEKMLEIMVPYAKRIYTVTPPVARGLDGRILAKEVQNWHEDVLFCESIEEAIQQAIAYGREQGTPVVAFGSLSYLGELKACYTQMCESRMRDV